MQPSESRAGNIFDLGYRRYDGERLGRRYSFVTLYISSLKSTFGIGRGGRAKIIPMGLAIVVFIPAAIQLGIATIANDIIDFIEPADYYEFVSIILALFIAAIAPELVCRDQRNHTLSLYFSRPLLRSDYAAAKVLAATSALLVLTLGPQTVLFIGNAFAGNDVAGYLSDEADTILPIVVSALILSLYFSTIALLLAAQTHRRAIASGAIIAAFVVLGAVAGISIENGDGDGLVGLLVLISPIDAMAGLTDWIFDVQPEPESTLDLANVDGWVYLVGVTVTTVVAAVLLWRRYQRINA